MSIFRKVELEFKGEVYTIHPDKTMGAIATIEEHFPVIQLISALQNNTIKVTALCACVKDVLEYAGAEDITIEQVYDEIMGAGNAQSAIIITLTKLIQLAIPDSQLKRIEKMQKAAEEANLPTGEDKKTPGKRTTRRKSSSRSTKRSSSVKS